MFAMAFTPALVALLLTLSTSATSIPQNSGRDTLQTCASSLDGSLPPHTPPGFKFSGNVRKYYIAAEEVEWDYAPTGWDNWMGVRLQCLSERT
jgi:hypothetical protein